MVSAPYFFLVSLLAALVCIQEKQGIQYEINNDAGGSTGSQLFEANLRRSAESNMKTATKFIWNLFGQSESADNRVKVAKIKLVLSNEMVQDSDYKLECEIGKIYISAAYIETSKSYKERGSDFLDLVYYEMTHILQWGANANGDIHAVAIRNGIAAYVVLNSRNEPRGYVKFGEGNTWYESPSVTGRFFQFVADNLRCRDFVPKLNAKMKNPYDEKYFVELTQMTITEAWKLYKDKYARKPS